MRLAIGSIVQAVTISFIVSSTAPAQSVSAPDKPPIEILGFKIGSDYYPMLDSKSSITTADNPDFPRTDAENTARRRRSVQVDDTKSRGKLRSEIRIIDQAEWVQVNIRNTGDKAIRVIDWDFAFPRYVDRKLELRFDVVSRIEVKPGGRKTLKQPLPHGATRCKTMTVGAAEIQSAKPSTFEAVCGPGVHDPSNLKQESVIIKRIEYQDGSVWNRQD